MQIKYPFKEHIVFRYLEDSFQVSCGGHLQAYLEVGMAENTANVPIMQFMETFNSLLQ